MTLGSTRIHWLVIPDGSPGTRRQRERETVRELLRQAIGYDGEIEHHADGAPYLPSLDLNISISHSQRLAVIALDAKQPIGIDAEQMRDALRRVSPRFLSETERMHCQSDSSLLRAWTAKEAVYKCAPTSMPDFAADILLTPSLYQAHTPLGDFAITYISLPRYANLLALATPLT